MFLDDLHQLWEPSATLTIMNLFDMCELSYIITTMSTIFAYSVILFPVDWLTVWLNMLQRQNCINFTVERNRCTEFILENIKPRWAHIYLSKLKMHLERYLQFAIIDIPKTILIIYFKMYV